jgi:DNA (cytosine-5)-methyltransferase 1
MRVVELCAGAGGMSLGLQRAGLEHALGIEMNASAAAVSVAAGFPTVVGDCADSTLYPETCDVLAGGIPCQPFSAAGQKLGALDPRNGWPWTLRAVDSMRPRWALFENVPGLLAHSAKSGCGRGAEPKPMLCSACYWATFIIPELQSRFAVVEHRVLDAADYGVPQRRHRVILVCGPRAIAWPVSTHSQFALAHAKWVTGEYWAEHGISPVGQASKAELRALKEPDELERWRTVRDALGIGGGLRRDRGSGMQERHGERADHEVDLPCPTLGAGSKGSGSRLNVVAAVIGGGANPKRAGGRRTERDVTDEPAPTIPAVDAGNNSLTFHDRHPASELDEPAWAIRSGGQGHTAPPVYLNLDVSVIRAQGAVDASGHQGGCAAPLIAHAGDGSQPDWFHRVSALDEPTRPIGSMRNASVRVGATRPELLDSPSNTVTAVGEEKGSGDYANPLKMQRASDTLFLATGVRRLTVEECAALQGFPADYPWHAARTKTDRYRCVGNAAPPQLIEPVARAIREADLRWAQEDEGLTTLARFLARLRA